MTLGDAKRKAFMLMDEYSSGGVVERDEDIAVKMNDFFDIAQKDVAEWQPIMRHAAFTLDGTGDQALPEDVARIMRITKYGSRARGYLVAEGRLLYASGDTDTLTLDYIATPKTITPDTPDDYRFEVSEQAANCLPFFVAAQQLIPDLVVDYSAFYNIYLEMRNRLLRGASGAGSGSVAQRLFRR